MKFKLTSDVLKDKHFKEFLNDSIEEEMHRRNNSLLVAKEQGYDLRSNTFIKLDAEGKMTVEWLSREFELIEAKKSVLCAHERRFIWLMVDEAIMKTVSYYEKPGVFGKIKAVLTH